MNTDIVDHDSHHLVGDSATYPMEPLWGRLAALGRIQLLFLG